MHRWASRWWYRSQLSAILSARLRVVAAGLGGGLSGAIGAGHYAACWTTVLAGGGIRGGQVVGRCDAQCVEATERPISPVDFYATVCRALNLDPHLEIGSPGGRPHTITPRTAQVISELF